MTRKLHKERLFIACLVFSTILAVNHGSLNQTKSVSNFSLQGKTVVIDPGHGGDDTGCVYKGIIQEKNITPAQID